ncbi:MAG: hypothetical protein E6R03_12350 [Hyphomicrobiaceae bacterium]|nr:MAG: hypothetical protein E6R03_12350 [Hyphomicrobiaceae bacterium]
MSRRKSDESLDDRLQVRLKKSDRELWAKYSVIRGHETLADFIRYLVTSDMAQHPKDLEKAMK